MSAFEFRESEVVKATGLPLRDFQRTRIELLKENEDWAYVGQRVCYAKNGLGQIMLILSAEKFSDDDLEALAKKLAAPAATPEPAIIQGKVHKFYPNKNLLGIRIPGAAKDAFRVIDIRVQSTKNFRPQMAVPVRCVAGRWELARRLPRNSGRW